MTEPPNDPSSDPNTDANANANANATPVDGEAATALTDLLLALQCSHYTQQLDPAQVAHNEPEEQSRRQQATRLWRWAFGAAGLAALAGAGNHAPILASWTRLRALCGRIVSLASGLAGMFLLMGGIVATVVSSWRRVWLGLVLLKGLFLGAKSWRSTDFRYVIYDYGSSMLALLALMWLRPNPASVNMRWGILLSFVAAAIQQKGPTLHPRFDQNSLYHLAQMVALHRLYRGAQELGTSERDAGDVHGSR